ncbi:ATP-binding protein [Streptomyces sp. NPDC060028]|uniref:ATP-binding protein n=1 Tax=Streptomyces sp. NPDC060028 TaxID=3347041 RepID=UPI0036B35D87
MCLHGPAGVGKTLAVNVCLRELERARGDEVCRITFRARPTARAVRHELFAPLVCRANPRVTHPSSIVCFWALSQPASYALVVDEAQWLTRETFEYFRFV